MIPTNSSNSTNGCDSISSNCVIWQGPDISCINLCNGDTISDVTAKLAELVCTLITEGVASNPNLTGLDLTCLNIPGTTPTTLVPVLQEMVDAICVKNTPAVPYVLPTMTLPACLVYNDPSGNPVTQLRLDLFTTLIANKVCDILTTIVYIQTTLTNHNTRLNVLEACVLPCSGATVEKKVVPTCIINVGVLTDVSVLLLALEVRFCALETAVGLPAAINAAISQGSCILSTTTTLADPTVSYGSIPGWNNTPINLAQSTQNIWAVLCDMYTAVSNIQLNCCPTGCDLVTFGYNTSNVLDSNGTISGINFNFQNTTGTGSVIPATFNDCAGSTIITVRDSLNVAVTSTVSVAALQNSAGGVTISLPGLNTYGTLTTSVAFCVTNGRDTCNDTIVKSVDGIVPCPTLVANNITSTEATITFTNSLGITPVYTIYIRNTATNILAGTCTKNSPGPTVSCDFTGLVAGTNYTVHATVQVGGVTKECTGTINFTTETAAAACTNGLDVVFVVDYTGSMSGTINTIKAGIPSTISTIQTASGTNDYRLALVIADEQGSATASYSTSVDYVALPTNQKIINTGSSNRYQFITAVEKFATNNATSFTTQLNKINTGAPTAGWPLGDGVGGPEPVDMAIGFVVESLQFAGTFRTGVAKYLLIYTDNSASGDDDAFTSVDIARLNSLAQTCLLQGIKCFVLGIGVNVKFPLSGTPFTYPWRDFAIATGGAWDASYTTATVNSLITNGCAATP